MAVKRIKTKKAVKIKKATKSLRKILVKKKKVNKKVFKKTKKIKIIKKIIKKIINKKPIRLKPKKKIAFKKVKSVKRKKVNKLSNQIKPVNKKAKKKATKKSLPIAPIHTRPAGKKVQSKKTEKVLLKDDKIPFAAESLFKTRIKVIGIGGGGGSIVSEIGRSLKKATFIIADTDIRALKKRSLIKHFWFGEEQTHGLGTGADPDLAKKAAEVEKEKMGNLFKDQDIVVLIASLGGGLGSGATKVFTEMANLSGAITLGVFTLPFKFEGKNKTRIAQKAIKDLRESLNISITIPNEKIFKIIDANTPITEAFSIINKNLIESLESLIDLIYNPGIINIDFADLRTILKGKGSMAFLNTVEESGKNRAEKIAEKILHNPLYQNSSFTAEKILFNISGSQNLSMFEVEKISRSISDSNPRAKIIFGISKSNQSKNKIKTTILMTGPGQVAKTDETPEEEKSDEKKISKKQKPKKIKDKTKKQAKKEKIPADNSYVSIFNKNPIEAEIVGLSALTQAAEQASKLSVIDIQENTPPKKTIRRNALEIKEAQELEENKKLLQEKEWEIPAFLRKVKSKN